MKEGRRVGRESVPTRRRACGKGLILGVLGRCGLSCVPLEERLRMGCGSGQRFDRQVRGLESEAQPCKVIDR